MRIRLDPALLHESGNTPTFVQLVSGGSGEGFWKTQTGARWKWTTRDTVAYVRCNSTADPNPYGQSTFPTLIPYRVNGRDRWASYANLGDGIYKMFLGGGTSIKTLELFVPFQNIVVFGGPVVGAYPYEIDFPNDVATAIAPVTTGPHRVIYADSKIAMNAVAGVLQGYAGLMKRGYSDLLLPSTSSATEMRYLGAYNAGAAYVPNDVVSSGAYTWLKRTSSAAGTTPAVGADWYVQGFLGRVTNVAHGTRRLFDDCATGGQQTSFATFLGSLVPTELRVDIGINDWALGFASAAALQAAYLGMLNAFAANATLSGIPILCLGPALTTGREANNTAATPFNADDIRLAIQNACAATTHTHVTYSNAKSVLTSADLADGLHFLTTGHLKYRQAYP